MYYFRKLGLQNMKNLKNIYLFVYLFVYLFIYLFIYSFIYLFINIHYILFHYLFIDFDLKSLIICYQKQHTKIFDYRENKCPESLNIIAEVSILDVCGVSSYASAKWSFFCLILLVFR